MGATAVRRDPALAGLEGVRDSDRWLRWAAYVFMAGFVAHNVDHARRGLDVITEHVVWAGTLVAIIAAVMLTLVVTRHAVAPLAAVVAGSWIVLGVSASHLLPEWSALSDSLSEGSVDAWTWIAVFSEIAGAVALVAAGLYGLRERRLASVPMWRKVAANSDRTRGGRVGASGRSS
jgi:hypothetical protein